MSKAHSRMNSGGSNKMSPTGLTNRRGKSNVFPLFYVLIESPNYLIYAKVYGVFKMIFAFILK